MKNSTVGVSNGSNVTSEDIHGMYLYIGMAINSFEAMEFF